jgi:hypothetical protein
LVAHGFEAHCGIAVLYVPGYDNYYLTPASRPIADIGIIGDNQAVR